jgi:hypothetical protein
LTGLALISACAPNIAPAGIQETAGGKCGQQASPQCEYQMAAGIGQGGKQLTVTTAAGDTKAEQRKIVFRSLIEQRAGQPAGTTVDPVVTQSPNEAETPAAQVEHTAEETKAQRAFRKIALNEGEAGKHGANLSHPPATRGASSHPVTGITPSHPEAAVIIPPHPEATGTVPPHPLGSAVVPAHPQAAGTVPAQPQAGGIVPSHPQAAGVIPSHPQAAGIIPSHPEAAGIIPSHPQGAGIIPAHPEARGIISLHPQATGIIASHSHARGLVNVKVRWSDVPVAVQETITENAGGGEIEEIEKENKLTGGRIIPIYEAGVRNTGGAKIKIKVDEDGNLIEKDKN